MYGVHVFYSSSLIGTIPRNLYIHFCGYALSLGKLCEPNSCSSNNVWKRFILIFNVRLLYVCLDFAFILFRITWWPSTGKELSPWLFARAIFILCRLNSKCSFAVRCLGQDMEFECIGS